MGSIALNEQVEYVETSEGPGDPCTFFFRPSKKTYRPIILLQDLIDLAVLPVIFLATSMSPAMALIWCEKLACFLGRYLVPRKKQSRIRKAYQHVLGGIGKNEWASLRRNLICQTVRGRLSVAQEFSPRRCGVSIEVNGIERLNDELDLGKGSILWVNRFSCYPIISKRALFQEGILAFAVSHKCHGYSDSRFAECLLNKIQIATEDSYLNKRLVFDDGEEIKVQKDVLRELKNGDAVLVTNTSLAGHRFVELPLGDQGKLRMSTGPISLALRTGAPLFSVSTFEIKPLTSYRLEIKKLEVAATFVGKSGKKRSEFVHMARVARASRDTILEGIRQYPCQSPRILLDE